MLLLSYSCSVIASCVLVEEWYDWWLKARIDISIFNCDSKTVIMRMLRLTIGKVHVLPRTECMCGLLDQ